MPIPPAASASPDPAPQPQGELALPRHAAERLERRARRLEVRRLRRHFEHVLAVLRGRDVSHLRPAQRAARERHLAELERYALRGRFPKNRDFPDRRMPYFVDAEGTRCAMAHLIEATGAAAFVERVVATANNAFVPELAGDPELVAWLEREGLTAEEAAMIQPSYCSTPAQDCFCYLGYEAVLEVTIETIEPAVNFRVDAVHGSTTILVGDLIPGDVPWFGGTVGDAILVGVSSSFTSPMYPINADGTVDTSTCFSMTGTPPATAPKQGAIDSTLSGFNGQCGATLPPEWNVQQGDCGGATTVTTASGPGGTGGAGGRGPGDGDPGSCSAPGAGLDGTSGGALLLGALLVASAVRARVRRPPRGRAPRR